MKNGEKMAVFLWENGFFLSVFDMKMAVFDSFFI
jgi:hypothetical protein